jgi:uncharacterized membrane protein YgcG
LSVIPLAGESKRDPAVALQVIVFFASGTPAEVFKVAVRVREPPEVRLKVEGSIVSTVSVNGGAEGGGGGGGGGGEGAGGGGGEGADKVVKV